MSGRPCLQVLTWQKAEGQGVFDEGCAGLFIALLPVALFFILLICRQRGNVFIFLRFEY